MIAYVIKCNDAIEAVVLDDEPRAQAVMAERAAKYFADNRHVFQTADAYRRQCYWHTRAIEVTP